MSFALWRRSCGITAVLLTSALVAACGGSDAVPPELLGRWTTTNPQYEGRAFAVSETSFTLFTGPEDFVVHPISRTVVERTGAEVSVQIQYAASGADQQFSVKYGAADGTGEPKWLHLANQPDFEWRRVVER